MLYYAVKIALSAALIVAISEIAKRHTGFAALIASLPLTSLLAFVWMYVESGSTQQISELSTQVFWLVIPSLALFILLPVFIKTGLGFWLSLGLSTAATAGLYVALIPLLRRAGVTL
ncbi:MAG: DUF3147 family protein [Burkholderiales bacterium]